MMPHYPSWSFIAKRDAGIFLRHCGRSRSGFSGEINKMTHVLHFVDEESIRLVSIADEMGGFTVDISINDLILPK